MGLAMGMGIWQTTHDFSYSNEGFNRHTWRNSFLFSFWIPLKFSTRWFFFSKIPTRASAEFQARFSSRDLLIISRRFVRICLLTNLLEFLHFLPRKSLRTFSGIPPKRDCIPNRLKILERTFPCIYFGKFNGRFFQNFILNI